MQDAVSEIMKKRRTNSAAPSAAEYRLLIKKSLATAGKHYFHYFEGLIRVCIFQNIDS